MQDDDDEIVTGIVLMRKGENPSQVLTAVKERVDDAQRHDPAEGRADRALLRSHLAASTRTLTHGVPEPARRRAARDASSCICSSATSARPASWRSIIPLSLLATFIGLTIRGIPANLLSLGAMDFGIIVDGAGHRARERLPASAEQHEHDRDVPKRDRSSTRRREVGRPTLFSMLIIILGAPADLHAAAPAKGASSRRWPTPVVSALIGSLLFSLTLVPLLSLFLLRQGRPRRGQPPRPVLQARCIARFCQAGAGARGASCSAPRVCAARRRASRWCRGSGTEFLPELNEGDDLDQHHAAAGHLRQRDLATAARASRALLRTFPKCASVMSKAGRPEDGTDPKMINMAEFLVDVKPQSEWRRGVSQGRS